VAAEQVHHPGSQAVGGHAALDDRSAGQGRRPSRRAWLIRAARNPMSTLIELQALPGPIAVSETHRSRVPHGTGFLGRPR
jgi:hypothetical protein